MGGSGVWRDYESRAPQVESASERQKLEPLISEEAAEGQELVSAILAGDRKATAEFVARYCDRIFGYVWQRMLPRTDLVEDLVQDILLIAWKSLPQYKGEGNLESWLIGIARHRVGGALSQAATRSARATGGR